MDPYFIRTRIVYDIQKPVIKAVMEWKNTLTAGEMSLTLSDLEFRLLRASDISENKLEYQKAINAVKEKQYERDQNMVPNGEKNMSNNVWAKFTTWLGDCFAPWSTLSSPPVEKTQKVEEPKKTTSKPKAKKPVGLKPKKKKKTTKK